MDELTILNDDGTATVAARVVDGTALLPPRALGDAIGWELKPEGLCRDDVCVPVRDREELTVDGAVDLAAVARVLRRPFVIDEKARVAVVGASAAQRHDERAGLRVRDFTLATVGGERVRWSSLGRKKKLLFAWASW